MAPINCRVKKSPNCYHGRPEESIYADVTQEDDGTWDGESVICDPCYIAVGMPLNSQHAEFMAASLPRNGGLRQ